MSGLSEPAFYDVGLSETDLYDVRLFCSKVRVESECLIASGVQVGTDMMRPCVSHEEVYA